MKIFNSYSCSCSYSCSTESRSTSRSKTSVARTLALIVGAAICAGSVPVYAAYVELSNGTKIEGTDIRAKSDGEIILTTAQGQRSFIKGQYVRAEADKPADFDKAGQLYQQKSFDE